MADPTTARLLALAVALVGLPPFLPTAHADDSSPAPTLIGSYDPATQGLTLTFSIPGMSSIPQGTVFTLFRNGYPVLINTPNLSTTRDLSIWVEGVRDYTATATLPGLDTSGASDPFRVVKDVVLPSDCPVASVTIYTRPPGASYTVYDECLPG